jgi:hypothetical protein
MTSTGDSMASRAACSIMTAIAAECLYLAYVFSLNHVGGFEKIVLVVLSAFVAGFLTRGFIYATADHAAKEIATEYADIHHSLKTSNNKLSQLRELTRMAEKCETSKQ